MKKTIAIIAAIVSVCISGIFTAPMIVKAIKKSAEDEELKAPLTEEIVLLDAVKTPQELGVKDITFKVNGENGVLTLESGSVKFEAGCGADSFTVNVSGKGSTTLASTHQAVYTADSRYELYKFNRQSLTPFVIGGGDEEVTIKLFARVGDRMYLIRTQKAQLVGADWVWELDENELPPVWID